MVSVFRCVPLQRRKLWLVVKKQMSKEEGGMNHNATSPLRNVLTDGKCNRSTVMFQLCILNMNTIYNAWNKDLVGKHPFLMVSNWSIVLNIPQVDVQFPLLPYLCFVLCVFIYDVVCIFRFMPATWHNRRHWVRHNCTVLAFPWFFEYGGRQVQFECTAKWFVFVHSENLHLHFPFFSFYSSVLATIVGEGVMFSSWQNFKQTHFLYSKVSFAVTS